MPRIVRAFTASALLASSLVLATTSSAATSRLQAKQTTVTVTMTEFKFAFSTSTIHAGKITFRLINKGKLAHDLKIAGKTSALVQPGKTGSLTVTLKKGKYPYVCTVPGHAAGGMKGVLTIS